MGSKSLLTNTFLLLHPQMQVKTAPCKRDIMSKHDGESSSVCYGVKMFDSLPIWEGTSHAELKTSGAS